MTARGRRRRLEVDLRIRGFGRFRCAAGVATRRGLERRRALARALGERGHFAVLRGLASGAIAWGAVEAADREQGLGRAGLADVLKLETVLAVAIADVLPRMGTAPATRARYGLALRSLAALGFDLEADRVSALLCEDWSARLARWPVAPATKNGVRAAVSRFLTRYLGDKAHPFRRAVLHEDRWPRLPVAPRVRGVTVAQFWALVERLEAPYVAPVVVLAASGMRVGELLSPAARYDRGRARVLTTGKTGPRFYAIDPSAAPFAEAWWPVAASAGWRCSYRQLWSAVRRAGRALGLVVSPHDCRRLYVRCGVASLGPVATQHAVGHATAAVTAEYAREDNAADVAAAVAASLGLREDVARWEKGKVS